MSDSFYKTLLGYSVSKDKNIINLHRLYGKVIIKIRNTIGLTFCPIKHRGVEIFFHM